MKRRTRVFGRYSHRRLIGGLRTTGAVEISQVESFGVKGRGAGSIPGLRDMSI